MSSWACVSAKVIKSQQNMKNNREKQKKSELVTKSIDVTLCASELASMWNKNREPSQKTAVKSAIFLQIEWSPFAL